MADRGRDLKVAILSDTSRFDTGKPARDLEQLATAADRADRALDRFHPQDTTRDLDRLGDEAKTVARRVDDAFDAIARSAKTGAGKLSTEAGAIRRKLSEVGDEAKDTAREALASFSSFGGDLADAGQEIAANAGALFGPAGLAIGGALSAGIALFKANSEELKKIAGDVFNDLVDAGGRLTAAAIDKRILAMGTSVTDLAKAAEAAGVPVADFIRAAAGDETAINRTAAALDRQRQAYMDSLPVGSDVIAMMNAYDATTAKVRNTIGTQASALATARSALSTYQAATDTANAATSRTPDAVEAALEAYRRAERTLSDPLVVRVTADTTQADRAIANLKNRYAALDGRFMP